MTDDPGIQARHAAGILLNAALDRRNGLDEALTKPPVSTLEPQDRAFARAVAMAALRRLGEIDAILDTRLKRSPPLAVRTLMRTALAQTLTLGTPAFAAVSSAVKLAERDPATRPYKALINAVLRGIDLDLARRQRRQAEEQVQQAALSRPAGAREGDHLTGPDFKVEVRDDGRPVAIGNANGPEGHGRRLAQPGRRHSGRGVAPFQRWHNRLGGLPVVIGGGHASQGGVDLGRQHQGEHRPSQIQRFGDRHRDQVQQLKAAVDCDQRHRERREELQYP